MSITYTPITQPIRYLQLTHYRRAWAALSPAQRTEMRREYRHLRYLDVGRHSAKGLIYRLVDTITNGA